MIRLAEHGGIADEWHTDLTSLADVDPQHENPGAVGGDTMWSNLCAAYEGLSPPLRDLCDGLSALHDAHPHGREDRMTIHPVTASIRTAAAKPFTSANISPARRDERPNDHLLRYLTDWVKQPVFTVRYNWTRHHRHEC